MNKLLKLIVSFAIFTSLPCFAMDASRRADQLSTVVLTGPIVAGDAERLVKTLLTSMYPGLSAVLQPQYRGAQTIRLDSPGGSVEEAFKIANLVQALHVRTEVSGGGKCASACFFIFLAGQERTAIGFDPKLGLVPYATGYVGLHRPYLAAETFKEEDASTSMKQQQQLMSRIRQYLGAENVPQMLVDAMMSRPSTDVYWLTDDDLESLGEYSPAYEELLIAKCGYDRKLTDRYQSAILSNDLAAHRRAFEALSRIEECGSKGFDQAALMARLGKGWRPWNEPL